MLDYVSTIPFASNTTEDVTFEIYKPSTARVIEFNRLNAGFREKARSLQSDIAKNERALADDAKDWRRSQEAAFARAQTVWAAAQDATTPEAEEAQGIIAGYQAEQSLASMRRELAAYDLDTLADQSSDDPRVVEVTDLLKRMEQTAAIANVYEEPVDLAEERTWLRRESELLMDEYYRPARIRWGVASISGFHINGKPVTVESQLQSGPPDLTAELFSRVEEVSRFSPDKLKKSSPLTTSSAPAVGGESNTTATPANTTSSTPPATAGSISLS